MWLTNQYRKMSTESNTQTQQQTLSGFNYKEKKRRDEVHNMT